jgi:hypothetical protein
MAVLESIGLLVAGGAIAVASSYLQRAWTNQDARRAEERATRQQLREARILPIRDFCQIARQSEVRESQQEDMEVFLDQYGVSDEDEAEYFDRLRKRLETFPRRAEVGPIAELALVSSPTPDIAAAVASAKALATKHPRFRDGDLRAALQAVDDLLDQYLLAE